MDILKVLGISIASIEKNSEADVEQKVTVPFLEQILGYTKDNGVDKKIRVAKNIPVGNRFETVIPDIAIYVSKEPFLMIESKPINRTISQADVNEAISNGRLYEFPKQFPFSIVSTGLRWETYDTLSGKYQGDHEVIMDIYRAKNFIERGLPLVPDSKRDEAERLIKTRRLI